MRPDRIIAVSNNKTVYREGDKCIKVFNNNYSKSDVFNEAINHTRIEDAGINAPKLYEVTDIDGKWAIVYEYIKGKTLSRLLMEHPERADEYMELFINLQLEVQSRKITKLIGLKENLTDHINESKLSDTARFDLLARLSAMPQDNKVCHGDFDFSNIIISDDGAPYIIDWTHVTKGCAFADAAVTYILFKLRGENDAAEKYLSIYCEKSETKFTEIHDWIPIVSASLYLRRNARERKTLLSFINEHRGQL